MSSVADWKTTMPDQQFSIQDNGFMPLSRPLRELPAPFHDMEHVMANLGFTLPSGEKGFLGRYDLGRQAEKIKLHDVSGIEDRTLLAALFRDYSILAAAYLLEPSHIEMLISGKYGVGRSELPANIAIPLDTLANKLQIHPILDYAHGYSLNNWYLADDAEGPSLSNMRAIRQFLGGDDEQGFILVHAAMVAQTPRLVQAQQDGVKAARDKNLDQLHKALETHADTLEAIMNIFGQMWRSSTPNAYLKFRTFIMGQIGNEGIFPNGVVFRGVSDEPRYYRGETGAQDSIIPSFDNFLQLSKRYPTNELTDYLRDLRYYRPVDHRNYLTWLQDAANDCGIAEVALTSQRTSLSLLRNLDCVQRFRSMHWTMTKKYIIEQTKHPVATGGTPITTWLPNNLLATVEYMEEVHKHLETMLVQEKDELSIVERDLFESIAANLDARSNRVTGEVSALQNQFKEPQKMEEFLHRTHA